MLRRGPDPVTRLAARYPTRRSWWTTPALAAASAPGPPRVSVAPAVFDEDVAEAIDALARPVVELPGGARLSIYPTPALVAIDVDAGGALAGSGGARARHEALNRALLPALAGQIRLRNLSGAIVVDLAGLSPRKRAALAPDFVAALADDPLRPRFLGFTALGLAEIVRPRVHPPLHELLAGPLAAGLAALRAVMAALRLDPRGMPALRAHPGGRIGAAAPIRPLCRTLRGAPGERLHCDQTRPCPGRRWVLEEDRGIRQPSTCPICGRRSSRPPGRSARRAARRSISAAG